MCYLISLFLTLYIVRLFEGKIDISSLFAQDGDFDLSSVGRNSIEVFASILHFLYQTHIIGQLSFEIFKCL